MIICKSLKFIKMSTFEIFINFDSFCSTIFVTNRLRVFAEQNSCDCTFADLTFYIAAWSRMNIAAYTGWILHKLWIIIFLNFEIFIKIDSFFQIHQILRQQALIEPLPITSCCPIAVKITRPFSNWNNSCLYCDNFERQDHFLKLFLWNSEHLRYNLIRY